MDKILQLPIKLSKRNKRARRGTQAGLLLQGIMDQLTVVHVGCAKLERRLGREWAGQEDPDITMIETAALKIGSQLNALRFRLEKPAGAKTGSLCEGPHTRTAPAGKLSLISSSGKILRHP
jgi:hypothetical protein